MEHVRKGVGKDVRMLKWTPESAAGCGGIQPERVEGVGNEEWQKIGAGP